VRRAYLRMTIKASSPRIDDEIYALVLSMHEPDFVFNRSWVSGSFVNYEKICIEAARQNLLQLIIVISSIERYQKL